ncbi:MAG: hypothetical protein RLZZ299_2867 [Pseudomonadota bacterium]|jgi:small subunit ribosomal protein S1
MSTPPAPRTVRRRSSAPEPSTSTATDVPATAIVAEPPAPAPAASVEEAPAPPPVATPAKGQAAVRRAPVPAPDSGPRLDLGGLQHAADVGADELAAMMRDYLPGRGARLPSAGERVTGRVSRITADTVFVDIGNKADAAIERIEVASDIALGDTVEAWVKGTSHGELLLTRSLGGDGARAHLEEARESRMPIEGTVVGANTGGLEVSLGGGVKAFCPLSHAGTPGTDPAALVGRTLRFLVLELRGRDTVVSRRALAEEEARGERAEALAKVAEGEVHDGIVVSLREFGAFVRLSGGAEGLVRLPNLARRKVAHPSEVLQDGQAVRVKVLAVDTARQRLDLGIRQTEEVGGTDAPARQAAVRDESWRSGDASFGSFGSLLDGLDVRRR